MGCQMGLLLLLGQTGLAQAGLGQLGWRGWGSWAGPTGPRGRSDGEIHERGRAPAPSPAPAPAPASPAAMVIGSDDDSDHASVVSENFLADTEALSAGAAFADDSDVRLQNGLGWAASGQCRAVA